MSDFRMKSTIGIYETEKWLVIETEFIRSC